MIATTVAPCTPNRPPGVPDATRPAIKHGEVTARADVAATRAALPAESCATGAASPTRPDAATAGRG